VSRCPALSNQTTGLTVPGLPRRDELPARRTERERSAVEVRSLATYAEAYPRIFALAVVGHTNAAVTNRLRLPVCATRRAPHARARAYAISVRPSVARHVRLDAFHLVTQVSLRL